MQHIHILTLILLASSIQLAAQEDNNASDQPVLPELSVEAQAVDAFGAWGIIELDGEVVENRGIRAISDLSAFAPNLYVNSNGIQSYGDVLSLRGVGNSMLFGDPGVVLYVDGVPHDSVGTYSAGIFDIQSLQIHPGSQGHRYGKNAPGGIIRISTRRPGNTHLTKLRASHGTFKTQSFTVLADGPMSETSSYYFGLNRSRSDGFSDNIDPTGNDATSEGWTGRLGFNWKTADGVEVGLGGTWEDYNLGAQPIVPRQGAGNDKYVSFYKRDADVPEVGRINQNSQYLSLSRETDFGRATSVTSRSEWQLDPNLLDLTFVDSTLANNDVFFSDAIVSTSEIREFRDQFAEEVRLESDPDSDHSWMVGLFVSTNEAEGKATRSFPNASFEQETQITSSQIDTKSYALFGSIDHRLNEETLLELGLRVDLVDRSLDRSKQIAKYNPGTKTVTNSASPGTNLSDDSQWVTPSLKIERELSNATTVFARSSYAGKPSGYSPYVDGDSALLGTVVNFQYERERVWAREIGIRHLNDGWGISISAYSNEITDFQFEKPSGGVDYFVDNAEEVEVTGLEVEFHATPSDGWLFSLAYGLSDSEIKKHSAFSLNEAMTVQLYDFAGKTVPFTPEYTLNASLTRRLDNGFYWNLGIRKIGQTHYLDQRANDTINPSHALLDARIGYEHEDWALSVFGTNLTDEEYHTALVSNLTGSPGIVGSPLVVGLSLSREF
jgi:iron complex outermembrane receptor protein